MHFWGSDAFWVSVSFCVICRVQVISGKKNTAQTIFDDVQTVCQNCDTEVPEGRRFCDRCGAPTAKAQLRAPDCPPGYQVFNHTWMGYSFHYPENWLVSLAPEGGAFIETSSGEAILELHLLPPRAMTTAPRQAELFLSRFGAVQYQVLPGSTPEEDPGKR